MHTHIAFFFIKWGLVRNKGALPFCRLWSKPAKDESFIFSRPSIIPSTIPDIGAACFQTVCSPDTLQHSLR